MKVFRNPENGDVISTVTQLTPQLEVETVVHGKPTAEVVRVYLDGERTAYTYGPDRPCIRIEFAPDGKMVVGIALFNDPDGKDFNWRR